VVRLRDVEQSGLYESGWEVGDVLLRHGAAEFAFDGFSSTAWLVVLEGELQAESLACACEAPNDAPTTPPPTEEELRLLRERVDGHASPSGLGSRDEQRSTRGSSTPGAMPDYEHLLR
jgi:hypothetical protein